MHILLLEEAQPSSFMFWFITEAMFALIVFALLYFFIVKNPKINKPPGSNEKKN